MNPLITDKGEKIDLSSQMRLKMIQYGYIHVLIRLVSSHAVALRREHLKTLIAYHLPWGKDVLTCN